MAIFNLTAGQTFYAELWGFDGKRWNGAAMVAPSTIAVADWGVGMVTLSELLTSNGSHTGVYTFTAPGTLPKGSYLVSVHSVNTFEVAENAVAVMEFTYTGAAEVADSKAVVSAAIADAELATAADQAAVKSQTDKLGFDESNNVKSSPQTAVTVAVNNDKSGYSIDGVSGGLGAAASNAIKDIPANVFKNGTVSLYARVYKDGNDIHQADVSTIAYNLYLLDGGDKNARTAVEGHSNVSLAAADVIFDTLQSNYEASNYNFKHAPPIAEDPAFTIAGRCYLAEYTIVPVLGETIIVRFKVNVL